MLKKNYPNIILIKVRSLLKKKTKKQACKFFFQVQKYASPCKTCKFGPFEAFDFVFRR
jgi:hypothetical protein